MYQLTLVGLIQTQVQEVIRDNATLKRRIEAMEADVHRRSGTDRDKFSVRVNMTVCLRHLSAYTLKSHSECLTL